MKFAINSLCKRQTEESPFSHFDGSDNALLELIEANWEKAKPSPNTQGVFLVPLPPKGFWSPIVKVTRPEKLDVRFEARQKDEEPYIDIVGVGDKSPAGSVVAVLYSHRTLGDQATTKADFELVTFNAEPGEDESPMHPVTMMRNHLGLPGGTKTEYTGQQYAEAIRFWSQHVKVEPR